MKRLTDDKTAQTLKEIIDKLEAGGFDVDMSNRRYVRLAEYERTRFEPSGWISVKDKMPEDHVNVLLVWSNGKVTSIMLGCHITIKNLGSDWHTSCGIRPEEEITHWMPLPEPPKEVKNDA